MFNYLYLYASVSCSTFQLNNLILVGCMLRFNYLQMYSLKNCIHQLHM